METRFLFPNNFKKYGMIASILSFIFFIIVLFFEKELVINSPVFVIWSLDIIGNSTVLGIEKHDILGTITGILLLLSMIVAAFSREKSEDEYITRLRLESLLWAVYFNCIILILSFLFLYGWSFALTVIINVYSILLIFILRFNFLIYKSKKS